MSTGMNGKSSQCSKNTSFRIRLLEQSVCITSGLVWKVRTSGSIRICSVKVHYCSGPWYDVTSYLMSPVLPLMLFSLHSLKMPRTFHQSNHSWEFLLKRRYWVTHEPSGQQESQCVLNLIIWKCLHLLYWVLIHYPFLSRRYIVSRWVSEGGGTT